MSLLTSVVITEEYNFMADSEELIGTTECLTLYTRILLVYRACCYNYCFYSNSCTYIHFKTL